jgi:hypothetical protein
MSYNTGMILEAFVGDAETDEDIGPHNLAAAIRVVADELSYTIFMPNNDVRVVETRELYKLADELDDL